MRLLRQRKCRRCGKLKIRFSSRDRHRCNECDAEYQREYRRRPKSIAWKKSYVARNKNKIRYHIQDRISSWKRKCSGCNLTVDYLLELFNEQKGKCYYTNKLMDVGAGGWNALSLDRLEPTKGYIQGNVVWCSMLLNTMKHTMTEKEFITLLRIITAKYNTADTCTITR